MAVFHYTLDETRSGKHKGAHVYRSRELLDAVLQEIPQRGDEVHLTLVLGPEQAKGELRLYQRAGVKFTLNVVNEVGLEISVDAKSVPCLSG
jgi:hypothetical protein